jgi:hypothetical protein
MPVTKTYPFLPTQFQSETNKKFLNATLDQLVTEPNLKPISGFVGRKFSPGNNDINSYIREPSASRANYQLEPGIVQRNQTTNEVEFAIAYPEFLQQINYFNGNIADPNKLFSNDYYSYTPYIDPDKFVNFGEYYWLPDGPAAVNIFANVTELEKTYFVNLNANRQIVYFNKFNTVKNPIITLTRGSVYHFTVDQTGHDFWIQTDSGTSGVQTNNNNLSSRQIFGVTNNGTDVGTVTFNVPLQSAQDQFTSMPIFQNVDLATTLNYSQIQGQLVSDVVDAYGGIDGQRNNLNGKYLIFTSNSTNDADWTANAVTVPTNQRYGIWLINVTVVGGNSYFDLVFQAALPVNNRVLIASGVDYGNTQWYTNASYQITQVPVITANLDTLYYQIGDLSDAYGIIKIADAGSNIIDVETEILNQQQYQSPNGVIFSNGLKVKFDSYVTPASYQNKEYYVEGVGTAISLVAVDNLIFSPTQVTSTYTPVTGFTDSASANISAGKDQLTITSNVSPSQTLIGTFPNNNNSNALITQNLEFNYPYRGGQNTQGDHASLAYERGPIGISLVGIPLYGTVNGWSVPGLNGTTWNLVSSEAKVNGEDIYGGTVNSNGLYYYEDSNFITANAWGNVTGFTGGYTQTDGHSKIIGFAADGYPIYGPFGYLSPQDSSSPTVRMSSSYQSNNTGDNRPPAVTVTLTANTTANSYITVASTFGLNPGMRVTVNSAGLTANQYWIENVGLATATGPAKFPGGTNQIQLNANVTVTKDATITFEYLSGVFVEDWSYVQGSGTLDQYNGRYCVTPEFPNGTYAYFCTQNISNQPVYPYFVGRAFYGSIFVNPITALADPDYLTINRSSIDLNAWSRRNRWFHKDIVLQTGIYNGKTYELDSNHKAKRPIIEFDPSLQLYNFGKVAKLPVDIFDTTTTQPFLTVEGSAGVYLDQTFLSEGMRVIFAADQDPTTRNKIWQVTYIDQDANVVTPKIIHLVAAIDSTVNEYETVAVFSGVNNGGKTFWFDGTNWIEGQSKTSINQAPLFDVFDSAGDSLSNRTKYPISNSALSFNGTKLFAYVEGTGSNDAVLGFPLSYQSFNNIGDIKFENHFATDTFTYTIDKVNYTNPINIGYLHKNNSLTSYDLLNTWKSIDHASKQYQLFSFIYDGIDNLFNIDIVPNANVVDNNLFVFANFKQIPTSRYRIYSIPGNNRQIWIDPTVIQENDRITVRVYSDSISTTAFYEVPDNLNNNLLNANFSNGTLGDLRNHYQATTQDNLDFIGSFPGVSNLRDLNVKPNAGKILQHAAPLSYAMMFLTNEQYDFVKSVSFAEQEYQKFKNKFLSLAETGSRVTSWTTAQAVDNILSKINEFKTNEFPYYYSGMVPYGPNRNVINYTIFDPAKTNYQISAIFDPIALTNKAVLVYLNGSQLLYGHDYAFSATVPAVTLLDNLIRSVNDTLVIYEYYDTDGSCIPETPTKLGLYPKFDPQIILDTTYSTPQSFIRGHDGSLTPVYNDFRDDLLLELERRIYNNIKVNFDNKVIDIYKAKPGKFRTSDFTVADYTRLVAENYLPWVGYNRLNYTDNTIYDVTDPFTYNYNTCPDTLDGELLPGSWRACYEYYYDTQRPNTNPWEMLGFSEEPDWWQTTYGPAPYTSGNQILWDDLEAGYIAAGVRQGYDTRFARPGLSNYIPVDANGNLKPPLGLMTVNFSNQKFNNNWTIGQYSPVENAWRNSSNYPYAVQIILALTNTASYFAEGACVNKITYDSTLNQFINKETNQRLVQSDVVINGYNYATKTVDRSASYINYIADYLTSQGIKDHTDLQDFVQHYQVNLIYRMAGYTNKNSLKVLAEQNSPASINESIIIPDSNFDLILNKSTPLFAVRYSAVVIEKVSSGFKISGYDNESPYFNIILPETNNTQNAVDIISGTLKVNWYQKFRAVRASVPYGTILSDLQQVANFLAGYEQYLKLQGFIFEDFDQSLGQIRNWQLSMQEFLFWVKQGWAAGSVIILSPVSSTISYFNPTAVADSLTNSYTGSKVQTQNWKILTSKDYTINRDSNNGNIFQLTLNNNQDLIASLNFDLVQYEHALVFNNVTEFNDVIYTPETGQRQYKLKLVGQKTTAWTGALNPPGFIYATKQIATWNQNTDYLRSDLVEYKGFYYTAKENIAGSETFDFTKWLPEPTSSIKSGLLENYATKAKKAIGFYDTDKVNLESDEDGLAFSLIGYKNRNYLSDLGITDTSQIKFYQGFIKQKGTVDALNAFANITVNNESTNVTISEDWAFRVGAYGATDINRYVELLLEEQYILNNPSSLEVATNNSVVYNSLNSSSMGLYDYSTATFSSPFLLNRTENSTRTDDIKTAGYVNIDDVDFTVYDLNDLSTLNGDINKINVGSIIWTAKNYNNDWDVYKISSNAVKVLSIKNSLNSNVTINTATPHGYNLDDTVILTNTSKFDGFYRVLSIVDAYNFTVKVTLNLTGFTSTSFADPASSYLLESQRVTYASQIYDMANATSWLANNKVWVDSSTNDTWAVYEKSEPWLANIQLQKSQYTSNGKFGQSLKISNDNNFALVGEPGANNGKGTITNYVLGFDNNFVEDITVSPGAVNTLGFGSSLDTGKEHLVIGAPDSSSGVGYAYIYRRNFLGTISETQILAPQSVGVEAFGTSAIISNDDAWIYIGASDANKVYAYGYYDAAESQSTTLTADLGNVSYSLSFTPVTTELLSVRGSVYSYVPFVDFTVSGSTITFNTPVADTIVVRQTPGYVYVDTISFANSNSNFGQSIAHTTDGRQIAVGAPADNSSAGTVTLYDRSVENFISIANQTLFGGVRTLGLVHKVYVNNVLQEQGTDYVIVASNWVQLTTAPQAGSIVTIETNQFNKIITVTADQQQAKSQFGYDLDICPNNCSLYIGAPYYTDGTNFNVGTAYRSINQSRIYGTIIGTIQNPTVTGGNSIRLNDYEVSFSGTSLTDVVNAINNANVPGVTAQDVNGYLQLNSDSVISTNKLTILPGVGTAITDLGLKVFVQSEQIKNPTNNAYDQFGYSVRIDSTSEILAVGGPTARTLTATSFDIYSTLLSNSQTLFGTEYVTNPRGPVSEMATSFDGNSTRFVDKVKSGAVWILSYLPDSRQTISHPGKFMYVQQLNPSNLSIALVPNVSFGVSVDISNYKILVGASTDSLFALNGGTVYKFNDVDRLNGWDIIRSQDDKVDIDGIIKGYVYNNETQIIIDHLDYIDPAKGKILGQAEQEITYKVDYDPAVYNNSSTASLKTSSTLYWGQPQVGQVWWDLSAIRYLEYEQDTIKYRTANWGRSFPGSSVDVYEWVQSLYPPGQYVQTGGNGIPKYLDDNYVTESYVDPITNIPNVYYYFWVKDKTVTPTYVPNRNIPIITIAQYIRDPKNSGIKYFAAIKDNAVAIYNVNNDTVGDKIVFHLDYAKEINSSIIHSEYALLSEKAENSNSIPTSIYNKLVDSVSGLDAVGNVVPDATLPVAKRYGIEIRPRQSMYIDKNMAVEQMVTFVNSVFATTTFAQSFDLTNLSAGEPIPPADSGFWDISVSTFTELGYIDIYTKPVGYKVLVVNNSEIDNLWTIYVKDTAVIVWTANTAYTKGQIISYENTAYVVTADFTSGTSFNTVNLDLYTVKNNWLLYQVQTYKTSDYWTTVDWYASYFDPTTQPNYTFNTTADMVNTRFKSGDVVKILNNGSGKWMLLQIFANTSVMVGLQDGTIELSTSLYDTATNGVGFGNDNFDINRFDQNPSIELRKIIEALKDDLFINQYSQDFVKLFFVLINYVLEEQKSVDWVFKTSFINVLHKIRGLTQPEIYYRENQTYYQQYLEEVKPFHTTIKEYVSDYTGSDNYNGYTTDFDVPAYYDPVLKVYRSPSGDYAQDVAALQQPQYADYVNNNWYEIQEIVISDGGSNYTVAPTIVISGSSIGDNALATPILANGQIVKVQVLYPGSYYYSQPVITLSGGNGSGARLYARLVNNTIRKIKATLTYDRYTYGSTVVEWLPNTTYTAGTILTYKNIAYVVNTTFTSGTTFNGNYLTVYAANNFNTANDRIVAYYAPTVGMPGKNPALLQNGISYPGVTVEGALFTDAGGFDVAAFDTDYFDALTLDSDGTYVISDTILDTKIESLFTDTSLGLRPEDIIVDGDGFVTPNTSHAPEELIPGRVYDTLDLTVSTLETLEDSNYTSWLTGTAFYVNEIVVVDGGSGYTANAAITILGNTGVGASGTLNVDANGKITSITLTASGSQYTTIPNVTVANTAANANLTFNTATLTARLAQNTYDVFSYRMFKDMNDNWTYLREDSAATTTLATNLSLTSNTITVANSAVLSTPNPAMNLPGVVYINGERITYFTKNDGTNTLGQLRRGTLGTGANIHYAGDTVVSGSINQIVPDSYHMANTFTTNTQLQMTNSIYRDFYAGQTYIQANLWLNGGLAAVPLAAEFTLSANVDIPFITSESNIGLETDQATTPIQTDGRGLYASNKIQALFVKKQLGA